MKIFAIMEGPSLESRHEGAVHCDSLSLLQVNEEKTRGEEALTCAPPTGTRDPGSQVE